MPCRFPTLLGPCQGDCSPRPWQHRSPPALRLHRRKGVGARREAVAGCGAAGAWGTALTSGLPWGPPNLSVTSILPASSGAPHQPVSGSWHLGSLRHQPQPCRPQGPWSHCCGSGGSPQPEPRTPQVRRPRLHCFRSSGWGVVTAGATPPESPLSSPRPIGAIHVRMYLYTSSPDGRVRLASVSAQRANGMFETCAHHKVVGRRAESWPFLFSIWDAFPSRWMSLRS